MNPLQGIGNYAILRYKFPSPRRRNIIQARRRHSREFKLQVIRELEAEKPMAEVARSYEAYHVTITYWRSHRVALGNGRMGIRSLD